MENGKNTIITFGELMMRLATLNSRKFLQAESFNVTYAGAEANVAVGLANLGLKSRFVTKLPKNDLGQAALSYLRKFGVDTDYIVEGGKRIGTYFCEMGYGVRGNKVIYDRENSSFSMSSISDYNWTEIFKDASWFHVSGITAAVLPTDILLSALKTAKENKITISIDYNFRSKLWNRSEMRDTMVKLIPYADIFFCGKTDACDLLELNDENCVIERLGAKFNIKVIATTNRVGISVNRNEFSAKLYTRDGRYSSKKYATEVLDRLGGGDAFACGLIYALTKNYDYQSAVDFAAAASVLKLTNEGDFLLSRANDVASFIQDRKNEKIDR